MSTYKDRTLSVTKGYWGIHLRDTWRVEGEAGTRWKRLALIQNEDLLPRLREIYEKTGELQQDILDEDAPAPPKILFHDGKHGNSHFIVYTPADYTKAFLKLCEYESILDYIPKLKVPEEKPIEPRMTDYNSTNAFVEAYNQYELSLEKYNENVKHNKVIDQNLRMIERVLTTPDKVLGEDIDILEQYFDNVPELIAPCEY